MTKPHTNEFVEAEYLKSNIKLLSVYQSVRVKNDLECLECNFLWQGTYEHFQERGSGCPKCRGSLKHTQEFIESSYLKFGIKLLSIYQSVHVKNDLECLECKFLWQATYANFQNCNSGCPKCSRLLHRGENHHRWNHELTKEDRKNSRNRDYTPDNRLWRKAVFKRDKYICQFCGYSKGRTLNAHHIDAWSTHESERLNVDNGVTLCETCHDACHYYHKHSWSHLSATHDVFYYWMLTECKIKPENWLWTVQYPDAMKERLKRLTTSKNYKLAL